MTVAQNPFCVLLIILHLITNSPAIAQDGVRDLFPGQADDEVADILCESLIPAEYDVVQNIGVSTIKLPVGCSRLNPKMVTKSRLELRPQETSEETLGSRIIERHNKWGATAAAAYISIVNPYPVPLEKVSGFYQNGDCGSEKLKTWFVLQFEDKIPASEAMIAKFEYLDLNIESGGACLTIDGATPVPLQDPVTAFSQALSFIQAEQWIQAGLLLDVAFLSGYRPDPDELDHLHRIVKKKVRALSATKALSNRDGYDLLLGFKPQNKDYSTKLKRYQDSSLSERTRAVVELMISLSGRVSLSQLVNELSNDRTKAQREKSWKEFKGKTVSFAGTVTDVKSEGLIKNALIKVEIDQDITGSCYVKEFLNESVVSISIGEHVSCTGEMFNYTLMFGELNISISESEYSR